MALTTGSRLGVYDVTALIGEGGMGQVYRARDTKLDRDVAIKILPEAFAHDADRLARFQREAKTLASLNHPNIAAIYGLEESGGMTALVMELVDGEDLSQRTARGAIPVDETLPIAKQIAEALEAAHEQGIIHRDLKPANVKLRSDGTVKVLDFGLAKAVEGAGRAGVVGGVSMSPTRSNHATQAGIILGTAAYMAPEQAKGRSVDRRVDIWAFGVVLYEMLTGRRAFEGEDVSDLLVAVLSKDVNLGALPVGTPPRLRALVRACLVRDPRQRLRDIGDARLVLDKITAGTPDDTMAVTAATTAITPSASRALPWGLASALAVVAVALSIPVVRHLRETPPLETRVDIVTPASAQPTSFALSPDGRPTADGLGRSRLSLLVAGWRFGWLLRRGRTQTVGPRWRRPADSGSGGQRQGRDVERGRRDRVCTEPYKSPDARVRHWRRGHARDDARPATPRSPRSTVLARRPPAPIYSRWLGRR